MAYQPTGLEDRLYTSKDSQYMQSQAQAQAVFQSPVKDVQNVWGPQQRASWESSQQRIDASSELRPQNYQRKFRNSYSGQLPYATMGATPGYGQMVPETTKASRVCINKSEEATPFYERYWPIVDHQPILPTIGDVDADPRYKARMTKTFTTEYKAQIELPGVATVKTITPTFGLY